MAGLMIGAAVMSTMQSQASDGIDPSLERVLSGGTEETKIKLRRRPGVPTDVYSWFEVTLQDIDVPSQTFQASIEIHLFWQDYNLPNAFPNFEDEDFEIHDDYVPVKMSEIFENKVEISNSDPQFKYYAKTGTIYMMFVVECTFVERMELQRFPLDRQFMNMAFNALIDPAIEDEGKWNWILTYPEWMPQELKKDFDKPFAVRMLSSITEYECLEPWVDFSGNKQPLSIRLRVNRIPAFYFGNIVFPNFLIVAGCFSAFVIPKEDVADRLSVTVTLMLAAVAFRFVVSTMLPKVSYLTIMDYYLLTGFIALIVLTGENAIVGIDAIGDAANIIDGIFAIVFGGFWVVIHLFALVTLLSNEFLRVSWDRMDEIDSAEDEESEFILADPQFVRGNQESDDCKSEWETYKKFDVLERADMYTKKNNIKRSGTFVSRLKERKSNKMSPTLTSQADTITEAKEEEEENMEIYVAPKISPQIESTDTKIMMTQSIELQQQKKEPEPEPEPAPEEEAPPYTPDVENETSPLIVSNNDDEDKKENDDDDVVVVNVEDDGDDNKEHGYSETMVVKPDSPKQEESNSPFPKFMKKWDGTDGALVIVQVGDSKKSLRVKPKNENLLNGKGFQGKFARWIINVDSTNINNEKVIKLKSTKSNKYLRIQKNGKQNVKGSGGKWTLFTLIVSDGASYGDTKSSVQLRSVQIDDKFITVDSNKEFNIWMKAQSNEESDDDENDNYADDDDNDNDDDDDGDDDEYEE